MKEIREDPDLELQIITTGMHLSPEFGLTYQQIEKDGFTVDKKIEILLCSDTPVGISKSMGLGMIGSADVYAANRAARKNKMKLAKPVNDIPCVPYRRKDRQGAQLSLAIVGYLLIYGRPGDPQLTGG